MYYWDPTFILLIPALLLTIVAQAKVSSTYSKYGKVRAQSGIAACDMARQLLDFNGLQDVQVEQVRGSLTDHYDPKHRVLRLSESTYQSDSVAALGVAAHEAGHALQHRDGYLPLKVRGALVPVANFGSNAAIFLIIIGLLIGLTELAWLGVIFFSAAVLFQLVTLPVEFNASNRAMAVLEGGGFLVGEELRQTRKVLSAAALTYVASALTAVLQLLRFAIMIGGRRD